MKISGYVHLYLKVEVQATCFLHLTRKSRFLQYVQEIFLHLCSILHLCVGNFPALVLMCRKFSCILQENFLHMFKIETVVFKFVPRKHFVGKFPALLQEASFLHITCEAKYPTKIKPTITFCRRLSCTSVGSQFLGRVGNQLPTH